MRALLLLLLYLIPTLAFAVGAFSVDPADKSLSYLGSIFGAIPSLGITSTGDSLFSTLIYYFNQSILMLAVIIIIYTTLIGTLNTAQEGQFLGKQWHPILVPFRAATGIYLLLPTTLGYNWIQIGVLWFIIQGVGAANAIWAQALNGLQAQSQNAGTTTNQPQINLTNVTSTVNSIFAALVCMEKINTDPQALALIPNSEPLTVYSYNNQVQFGLYSQRLNNQPPLCGAISIPSIGTSISQNTSDSSTEARTQIMTNAVLSAANLLTTAAYNSAMNLPDTGNAAAITSAQNTLTAAATSLSSTFPTQAQFTQQQSGDGWIFAGSYYFQLVRNGFGGGIATNLGTTNMNSAQMNETFGNTESSQIQGSVNSISATNAANSSNTSKASSSSSSSDTLQLNPPTMGSQIQQIYDAVFGTFFDDIIHDLDDFMTQGAGDPLVSMATFGSLLTNLTELTFWGALLLVFTAWSISAVMSCMQPLGPTLDFVMAMFMPIAALVISLLWAEGLALALYVPLIPYLVFTFAALGWIILVIESLLGSPLIALSLVIPSEDEIGKAGHAFVILLGLFLRPSLMILGFIFAVQLLTIGVGMLNFGFWSTLTASTGASAGVGIFGLVAVIFMYVAIAIGMVHEAFSLIYQLPNKILRWLGSGPEGDEAGSHAKELKSATTKGAGYGKSMMSSTLGKFSGGK